jgi:hypothetical protein
MRRFFGAPGGPDAACVTVNVLPPTEMFADREVVAVFAVARKLTVPLPVPVDDVVNQVAVELADHVQDDGEAVSVTLPVAPAAATEAVDVDSV